MSRNHTYLFLLVILLLTMLLAACGPLLAPVRSAGETSPPIEQFENAGADDPTVFVDEAAFQAALLRAIQARDEATLARLTAEEFLSGVWRGEQTSLTRAGALRELYQDLPGEAIELRAAPTNELAALLGGINPLAIPRPGANVIGVILVTGWGQDGEDEAILFVSRQPDNSLRWAGALVVRGGFTSPKTGGVQPLVNAQHGYQTYLPLGYEIQQSLPHEIAILAPQGIAGHRERAFVTVEPARGRTAEQIVTELKTTMLASAAEQPAQVMGLDTELALVFDRVPGQNLMRVLFVVHEDRLYRMSFLPQDESQPEAHDQMRNLYAVVTNTFRFIPVNSAGPVLSAGGKLVADPGVFAGLLQQGLAARDEAALQSMMGDTFTLAFWRSEGFQTTPGQAIEQILTNYVPAGGQPVLALDHPVIRRLFSEPTTSPAGERLIPVHAAGWGADGQGEAVLFIARRADGSLYWQGALAAPGGFD